MWLPKLFTKRNGVGNTNTPPFPSQQLFVLALCRICEPIAFMSIFPYVYYMVLSFDITSDTRKIAVYVGMVTSAFAFAEFSSGVIWGRISDRTGRKPVLIAGLAGTALSMMVFGLAPNLPVALLGRALGGLLNGNMGVLQTTVAELVKTKEHQPRAYSIMPFVWCLGSVLGPAMGGALAHPCKNFPTLFPRGTIFDRFPFLLPNLVCAIILAVGVIIGVLFLEETHVEKKQRRDPGLLAGQSIVRFLKSFGSETLGEYKTDKSAACNSDEVDVLIDDDVLPEYSPAEVCELPGYRTTDGTPRQSSSRSQSPGVRRLDILKSHRTIPSGVRKAFTKQVILTIMAFGILAYHSISFDQLMPVFLSEPVTQDASSSLFRFTGGFGYSTKKIGVMLSVQGVYSMVAQLFIFPFAARTFGTLKTFRLVMMIWPLLYLVIPYMVLLPKQLRDVAVFLALLTKITFQVMAFPSTAILLANAAPSMLVLGTINGVSASTASLARAFGPTITGLVHSWGLKMGSTGLAWWLSGTICAIGAIESLWMEEVDGRLKQTDAAIDEEAGSQESLLDPAAIEAAISAVDENATVNAQPILHKSDSKISCGEVSEE